MIATLYILQMQPGLYEYRVRMHGQELFSDAGYDSIASAIKAASNIEGPITAMEVAYSGIVEGTYSLYRLRTDASGVVTHLVATMASILD
jgi:hypothetical protein